MYFFILFYIRLPFSTKNTQKRLRNSDEIYIIYEKLLLNRNIFSYSEKNRQWHFPLKKRFVHANFHFDPPFS